MLRAVVVVAAALLTVGADNAPDLSELLAVMVMHRHGARTEPVVSDTELNWDGCVLSSEGVLMALSLGRYLRGRYDGFVPESYSRTIIDSRSTDFERTIRTGVGVLRGMFPQPLDVPFLMHPDVQSDILLSYYYSWPSAIIRGHFINGYNARTNAETLAIINQTELDLIGEQLHCPHICATQATTCALLAEDVSTCRLSNGGLSPQLRSLLPKLFLVQEQSNAFLYMYNNSNSYWSNVGTYAYPVATRIAQFFGNSLRKFENPNATEPPTTKQGEYSNLGDVFFDEAKVLHYSVHDITIYGFFVAIGAINTSTTDVDVLVPTFASAAVMELYKNGSVKLLFATCDQEHGSAHNYRIRAKRMACISESNETYWATMCPLGDYLRFVRTMAPASAEEFCYAAPSDVLQSRCNDLGPPSTSDCLQYRQLCPRVACPLGYYLRETDYSCQPRAVVHKISKKSVAGPLIFFSSLALGAVIGVLLLLMRRKVAEGRTEHTPLLR